MLALLLASLLLTAILVRNNYSPQNTFVHSARLLEHNLQQKEKLGLKYLSGPKWEWLKTLPGGDEHATLKFIRNITSTNRIWLVTYQKDKLSFWTGVKVLPNNYRQFKNGTSFVKMPNGYYEVIRKTEGNFTALMFIPVKYSFRLQNQFLKNIIEPSLLESNDVEIADVADKNVYPIYDSRHNYLFSVTPKPHVISMGHTALELVLWGLIAATVCLLLTNICNYMANKGRLGLSFLTLALSILFIRIINIAFHFPDFSHSLKLFDPAFFTMSAISPSLGDFSLNLLCFFWLVCFIYYHRRKILVHQLTKVTGYIVFAGLIALLFICASGLIHFFKILIISSSISFDVNNLLNLSGYSLLSVLMSCFAFLSFYLLAEIALAIDAHIAISDRIKLLVFSSVILLATGLSFLSGYTFFYILWAVVVIIRAFSLRFERGYLNSLSYVIIIVACALIASIKLNYYQSIKEKATRKQVIQSLANGNNLRVRRIFKTLEAQIIHDPVLIRYFKKNDGNAGYLQNHLQKLYFDGYLSDYNCKIHQFDVDGNPMPSDQGYAVSDFKDMVIYSSLKLTNYFYRENDAFGFRSYFAILPVYEGDTNLGTIIIELKSKPLHSDDSFPELLMEKQLGEEEEYKDYSYAFYRDDQLQSQSGTYNYDVVNNQFKGKLKQYIFKTTSADDTNLSWYEHLDTYSHLIYQPSPRKVIVVSRQENNIVGRVASLTFFFVTQLVFSAVVLILSWLWRRLSFFSITPTGIHWDFKFNFEHLLYKTRIQFSMIFAVLVTLALVGVITFISIKTQYQAQQDETIINKVTTIAAKFETNFMSGGISPTESNQVKFNNFANNFSTDLILFDRNGVPLLCTQPKIYDYGILARRMQASAYILLTRMQKSVLINSEKIAGLSYKAAYAPIRNSRNQTVAYLQLPYFSNVADYRERVGSFLNAMINIYALIFVAIGCFAVVIARQITTPLSFIQHNLSRTIYGKKNEPIQWKRDDEIGALVKEYNKMISALENSAQRLAQSERESAWREMAKQVAHEIKNPLTPLKLGLQLLEKSWKDKDPKFDIKFERFSKSFVEQIESLSNIASEFSAFAKMPDARMEGLNVFETLGQAVIIFKQMDNLEINYAAPAEPFIIMADRDQLLRCFNNLLKNAIEAMPTGRKGQINIKYTISRNSILLSIQDNGNGIPENLRERIFEPNFTTKSSGTGLGLAFIKNSIENAGGKIWFETLISEGTTFYLNFPAAKGEHKA